MSQVHGNDPTFAVSFPQSFGVIVMSHTVATFVVAAVRVKTCVHVVDAPAASGPQLQIDTSSAVLAGVPLSSTRVPDSVTSPVFVIVYVLVTFVGTPCGILVR